MKLDLAKFARSPLGQMLIAAAIGAATKKVGKLVAPKLPKVRE